MLYFDIGANIGLWTLANIKNCDKIICVEASNENFINLLNNTKNMNIECLNYAACNNNCEDIIFYNCGVLSTINKNWLSSEKSRFFNTPYTTTICKTITIDILIEKYGIPDLLKIDVEAGEFNCISSLTKKVPMLCFEWASETNDITFNCVDYLYNLGFKHFFVQDSDNYTFRPSEYYDIEYTKNLLLKKINKNDWGMIWCI